MINKLPYKISLEEETHTYTVDGVVVPSWSEIAQDCGLSDYSHIHPEVLYAAQEFGKAVHLACHLYNIGKLDESSVCDELKPYLEQWKKFLKDEKLKVVNSELMLYSKSNNFAGTIDCLCEDVDGKWFLVDIKTSSTINRSAHIQTAAYEILLLDNGKIEIAGRKIVQLKTTTYKCKNLLAVKDLWDDSLVAHSCFSLYHWKHAKKKKK